MLKKNNIESEFHYAAFKAIALKPVEKIAEENILRNSE
jgi:hypothetical protein